MGEEGLSGVFKYQFLSLSFEKKEKFLNEAIGCGYLGCIYMTMRVIDFKLCTH